VPCDPITPAALLEPDLLVVLGGPIGVYETRAYPFLAAERDAIAARLAVGGPTIGICLGAQLVASALGADVRPTCQTEIGYAPLTLTPSCRNSILAPLADRPVLHWHGDEFAIPDGSTSLAETPGFPHQAFTLGRHALALQFHLEADPTRIEQWLIGHAHELASLGLDPTALRSDAALHGPGLAQAGTEVFDRWLAEVPG